MYQTRLFLVGFKKGGLSIHSQLEISGMSFVKMAQLKTIISKSGGRSNPPIIYTLCLWMYILIIMICIYGCLRY